MEYRIREEYDYCVIEVKARKRFLWLSKYVWFRSNIYGRPNFTDYIRYTGSQINKVYTGYQMHEEAELQIKKWRRENDFKSKYHYV